MIFIANERYIHNEYEETKICLQGGPVSAGSRFSRERFGLGRFGAVIKIEGNKEERYKSSTL